MVCFLSFIFLYPEGMNQNEPDSPSPQVVTDKQPQALQPIASTKIVETVRDFQITKAGVNDVKHFDSIESQKTALPKLSVQLNENINQLLDNSWSIISCEGDSSYPEYIAKLHFQLLPNYPGDLYLDQENYLNDWSKTVVSDFKTLLFPDPFYTLPVVQLLPFYFDNLYPSYGIRRSAVSVGGVEKDFAYVIHGDDLLIGTNFDCLVETMEYLIQSD